MLSQTALLGLTAALAAASPFKRDLSVDPTSVNTKFFGWPTYTTYEGPTATGIEPLAAATAYAYEESYAPLYAYRLKDNTEFNYIRHFGQYSPWYSNKDLTDNNPTIPGECDLVQWHVIHRHAERYPTTGSGNIGEVVERQLKEKTTKKSFKALTDATKFLESWKNPLGGEIMTIFGRGSEHDLGLSFRLKYGRLLDKVKNGTKLVFRTTSENRMLETSRYMASGFFGLDFEDRRNMVVQIEALGGTNGFNSTLAPWQNCANNNNYSLTPGSDYVSKWEKIFLKDAVKRIGKQFDGLDVDTELLSGFLDICAYETVDLGASAFCPLFTPEEFKGYAYGKDLSFWYGNSYGNPTSGAIGKGWAQEWLARVQKQPLTEFNSSTNATLHDKTYFPLDQPIYVDATHDTIISAIVTALNFTSLRDNFALPYDHIPENKKFDVSKISPFASNLQAQIFECPALKPAEKPSEDKPTAGKYVRWVLNDGVVDISNVPGCGKEPHGLCYLPNFVDSIKPFVHDIDYQYDCGANYTYPSTKTPILNGQPLHRD